MFSQFTSFLALVRARLDAAGVSYEYLDGRVRDRQARVDRFQNDAACPLFLISLKAGGHGLNLTAADYVYHARSVVESGGRGAGDRPRASHRADAAE